MKILLANTTAYPTIGGVENSLRFIGRELLRAGDLLHFAEPFHG